MSVWFGEDWIPNLQQPILFLAALILNYPNIQPYLYESKKLMDLIMLIN